MLGGEYRHSLDAKNRIFVPAKFKEELGETIVLFRDFRSQCVKMYSVEGWDAYTAKIEQQERAISEKVMRYLSRNAAQVTPDAQGRVVLPPDLVTHAGIQKGVVVNGCGDYAEIWSEENYDAMVAAEDAEEIRRQLEALGL